MFKAKVKTNGNVDSQVQKLLSARFTITAFSVVYSDKTDRKKLSEYFKK